MGRDVFLRLTPDQARTVGAVCVKVALLSSGTELALDPEERHRLEAWADELILEEPQIGPGTLEYVGLEMLKKVQRPAPHG